MERVFKFVVYKDFNEQQKLKIEFGYVEFHRDLLPSKPRTAHIWYDPKAVGGGQFEVIPSTKTIMLFGESSDFGKIDSKTLKVLTMRYKEQINNDIWYALRHRYMNEHDCEVDECGNIKGWEFNNETFNDYKFVIK